MTGPVGARINRPVALMTDDFRIYHVMAPFFEAQGVQLLGLRPGDEVPDAVQVILGGPPEDRRSIAVHEDPEVAWLAVLAHLRGAVERVTVGVDPGQTIGVAVLVHGKVYWAGELRSPDAVVERLLAWRHAMPDAAWSLHVGDGAPAVGRTIRGQSRRAWRALDVSTVPETGSTPTSAMTGSRHADAAIRIAMRTP